MKARTFHSKKKWALPPIPLRYILLMLMVTTGFILHLSTNLKHIHNIPTATPQNSASILIAETNIAQPPTPKALLAQNKPAKPNFTTIQGTIQHSFYQSLLKAGLSAKQALAAAKVFEKRVQFSKDLQPNDRFSLVLSPKTQQIIAAQLQTTNGTYIAILKDNTYHIQKYNDFHQSLATLIKQKTVVQTIKTQVASL